jgi:hypothetical protein
MKRFKESPANIEPAETSRPININPGAARLGCGASAKLQHCGEVSA